MATRTRGGDGKFIRTIHAAQRDFQAAEMRAKGIGFEVIAAELGFASRGHAHDAVMRALRDTPYDGAELDKRLDLLRIDRLIEKAWEILERDHLAVSQGKVVIHFAGIERDEDGIERLDPDGKVIPIFEDVLDDAPKLAAIREIRGLLKRRAEIIGYDAPSKSRIEVVTSDMIEAEITRLEAELGKRPADRGVG